MEMKQISETTLKIMITMEDLEEHGMELKENIGRLTVTTATYRLRKSCRARKDTNRAVYGAGRTRVCFAAVMMRFPKNRKF